MGALLVLALLAGPAVFANGREEANSNEAGTLSEALTTAIAKANLVVVAEVIGLADDTPGAQGRRAFEVHRVRVESTLKGVDLGGGEILVRPFDTTWSDGERQVLFLNWTGAPPVQAFAAPRIPATPANIAAIESVVAARGERVAPSPRLSAEVIGGWQSAATTVLTISADDRLDWRHTADDGVTEFRTGLVARVDVDALITEIEHTAPGPRADDGGVLYLRWRDAAGVLQTAEYDLPHQMPAAGLLKALRALAHSAR